MRCSRNMSTRFSSPLFLLVLRTICWMSLLSTPTIFAADHLAPIFPRNTGAEAELAEPPPLPKRNPLLQRPQHRQVIFDGLDPVGTAVPQTLIYDEDFDLLPQITPQGSPQSTPQRQTQTAPSRTVPAMEHNNAFFTENGTIIHGEVIHSQIISEYPFEMTTCAAGSFPLSFGMGLFDNITLFAESTAFKTGLSNGAGSLGISEGINWSAAVTPQGAVTAQYGVRAVQGEFFNPTMREQLFMTAGLFKRFDFARFQGGAAIDWLSDRSQGGNYHLRQLRCELSTQVLGSWDIGFIGGFNVFQDRPAILFDEGTSGVVDVHDHYLLFVRKYLNNGGQVEFRSGATARGDFIMSAQGEIAVSDRLAVNGGLSMLAPSNKGSHLGGNYRESWAMSMGVVLYFRGGAVFRQINSHRPMFDVAGNNSLFTRITGL